MCDNIDATVAEWRATGDRFLGPVEEREYDRVTIQLVPGTDDIQLCQPTHTLAYDS